MAPAPTTHEPEAFEHLVTTIGPKLSQVLRRYQIPPEDAEDLVQDTLLMLWERLDQVHNPPGWLLGTLRNKCILYWRAHRKSRTVDLPANVEQLSRAARIEPDEVTVRSDLHRALRRLPPRLASLVWLRRIAGWSRAEAGAVTGYKPDSQSKALRRARHRLHEVLEPGCR